MGATDPTMGSSEMTEKLSIAGSAIEDLGVLPTVAVQINELAEKPGTSAENVAEVILRDPTLISKVLRIINSTFYGLRHEVQDIRHAVAYLGIHQVRNLVLSSALIESFRFEHGVVEPETVWEHSLGCAIGAKRLGDALDGLHGDGAYLGGLLHDIGRIVLLSRFPKEYAQVVDICERGLCPLRDAETSRFEISHEEAGYVLARAWGFSEPVQSMIRHHHDPAAAGELAVPVALIAIANAICHREKLRFGFEMDDEFAEAEKSRAWDVIVADDPSRAGVDRAELEDTLSESVRHTKDMVAEMF